MKTNTSPPFSALGQRESYSTGIGETPKIDLNVFSGIGAGATAASIDASKSTA